MNRAPLIVHLLYRLDVGGLETLLLDCIARMPHGRYRHAIVCLDDVGALGERARKLGVELYALHKPPGLAPAIHLALWKLLRTLRPALLHTYNLAAIEYQLTAVLAGVPARVHAEHGRLASDPDGSNRRHNLLRRLVSPLLHYWVPVSENLRQWLADVIKVPGYKNQLVANGVDTARFRPDAPLQPFFGSDCFVIGTVGRLDAVKNHAMLLDAFMLLRAQLPAQAARLRLVIVGDGPCMQALRERVELAGLQRVVRLAGKRDDIAPLMRAFSVFALPSIAEGTPVTLLEAMASGLPVVATSVGGVPEVVCHGETGQLVLSGNAEAMADALAGYCLAPATAKAHGAAGRQRVRQHFNIDTTVHDYLDIYDALTHSQQSHPIENMPCAES
jgi:sugar transferase (PEP-CTERM/EpsH1 system associated)